jgi:signal transduction histidine kinase
MNPKLFDPEKFNKSKNGNQSKLSTDINEKQDKVIQNNHQIIQILEIDFYTDVKKILKELLGCFKNDQFSSIRIILDNPKLISGNNIIAEGIGEQNNLYAYLDAQIGSQIGNSGILYISDTLKIHTIKFSEGNQFPKTILGIAIETKQNKLGYIWFASYVQKVFTKIEADALIRQAEACGYVIQNCLLWNENNFITEYLYDALNLVNLPLLVISKNTIIFSNQNANNILRSELEDNILKEKLVKKIWNFNEKHDNQLVIDNQNYQVNFCESARELQEKYRTVLLIDKTISQRQKNYTSLVFNSINQSLRSPLNIVLGSVKMIPLIGETNKQQKEYLSTIEKRTNDSIVLVEELLDLDRLLINDGLRVQKNDVRTLIAQSSELIEHLLKQKRISINCDDIDPELLIDADKSLFTQALINILEYAIGQTRLGEILNIYANSEEGNLEIQIVDKSSGLAKIDVDKLNSFENIYEIPSNLLLARRIIEFHMGTFTIQSEQGKGNTYIIKIPRKMSAL